MSTARHLRPVADLNGEVISAELVQALHDKIARLTTDVHSWHARYSNLARDREAEAAAHHLWPVALELFNYWRQVCGHPGSRWGAERFFMVLPHLKPRGGETVELAALRCKAAIAGLAFDHYSKPRRNGTVRHYTDWEHVFGSARRFDDCLAGAPPHVQARLAEAQNGAAATPEEMTAAPQRKRADSDQGTLVGLGQPPIGIHQHAPDHNG